MRNFPYRGEDTPLRLFVAVLLLVFFAEVLVSTVMISLFPTRKVFDEILSGAALTVLLAPGLYIFLVLPLQREVSERRQAQAELENRVRERTAELRAAQSDLEQRIQQRTAELEHANQDLEKFLDQEKAMRAQLVQTEKFAALGRMVASVAHELNNPLQTIRNCLYLIEMEKPAGNSGEFLALAASEIQRLSELVAQLREVYRPRAAGQMQPCDLATLLEEVRQVIHPHLQHQHVTWELVPCSEPLRAFGIPNELKQVFINLALNGMEAMQPQGGQIRVRLAENPESHQVGVAFEDRGPGIPPADLPHIFEPLFTTKETGLGLGLSISYDIVQKHNGWIQVENQPDRGAAFTVWLPAATPSDLI